MAYKNPFDERARLARRKHYEKNKPQYYRNNQIKRERMRAYINKCKDVPCGDCGKKYPSYVMDFDHTDRSNKLYRMSALYNVMSWKKMLQEIAKCEVVCANCHRERSAKQLGYK